MLTAVQRLLIPGEVSERLRSETSNNAPNDGSRDETTATHGWSDIHEMLLFDRLDVLHMLQVLDEKKMRKHLPMRRI